MNKNKDYTKKKDEYIDLEFYENNKTNYKDNENNTISELKENKIDEEKIKIILPSEKINKKKKIKKKIEKFFKIARWSIIIFIISFIYLFYDSIILKIFSLLKENPTIYNYYLFIEEQITNYTKLGILFLSVFGALFFLALPSEALFIYLLENVSYNLVIIIGLAILGNIIGLIINYLFGFFLGEKAIRFLFKKNFFKYKERIDKWGGLFLFFGNIFPGPIEVLSVFYGGFKFSFKKYIYLSFMGRFIKYILLYLLYITYWDSITNFFHIIKSLFGLI
jgi:membrane protein YqaA with SNARE-associated domain